MASESDPWAWQQWAAQQDPSLYGWQKSDLYGPGSSTMATILSSKPMLQAAGLWRPEWDVTATASQSSDDPGIAGDPYANLDLSSLQGYQYGMARGPDYTRLYGVFDPQGNLVGRDMTTDRSHGSMTGKDYATAAAVLAAGYGLGTGLEYMAGGGLGAAGGAAAGETAALSSGQVGALSGAGEAGFTGLSSAGTAGTAAGGTGLGTAGTAAGAVGGGLTFGGGTATGLGTTGLGAGAGSGAVAGAGGLAGSGLTFSGGAATSLGTTGLGTAGAGTGLLSSLAPYKNEIMTGVRLGGGLLSSYTQGEAAKDAAAAQQAAAAAGQQQLAPYAQAGLSSIKAQQDLAGLNGPAAQQAAIAALQASPEFTAKLALGEKSILANASATGGLRGGNVQAALAQFSPQLLADQINQQYTRLGGLTQTGLSASGGVVNLIQQGGAAAAGGELAQGRANAGYIGALVNAAGLYAGMSGW